MGGGALSDAGRVGPGRPPVRVTHLLWRLSVTGGVQTVVRSIARHVDPQRVALSVVTVRSARDEDALAEVPVPVEGLGFDGARLGLWTRLALVWRAARAVRAGHAEVVHLHSGTLWLGVAAGGLTRRRRLLVEVHDAPGSGRHGRWTDRFEGWMVRATGATVTCHSDAVAQAVIARWGVRSERVHTCALAVDVERFQPRGEPDRAAVRRDWQVPAEVFVVGLTGRLVASKRVQEAAEAVAEIGSDPGRPAPVLVLVGDGPERAAAVAVMRRAGLGCVETGALAPDAMARAVAAVDVVVSASEYEGFGLTLAEAMASGVPVVATDVGGVGEVVEHGLTGRLVPLGDRAALSDALRWYRDHPDDRRAAGQRGVARVRDHFGPQQLAEAFTRTYEELAR